MKPRDKKPLYRKVNTRTHGVWHHFGGHYRHYRRTTLPDQSEREKMKKGVHRGLDYTPLFRFLLSKVSSLWDEVHSEAVSRLDKEEPIFWIVAEDRESGEAVVHVDENTYYSGLFVDDDKILRVVAPEITADSLEPTCSCCTHTLNGERFTKEWVDGYESWPDYVKGPPLVL